MSVPTLYDFELDDQCYTVRLLFGLLDVPYTRIAVNMLPGHEQTRPPLSDLNPLGTLPILVDGAVVLREAVPILAYVARAYDASGRWLPDTAAGLGAVMVWLHFAVGPLGCFTLARREAIFGESDGQNASGDTSRALRFMEDHLVRRGFAGAGWFAGDGPTLADIALFPAFALSRDIGIDHEGYPALRSWMRRFRALPGFATMPGIPDYH